MIQAADLKALPPLPDIAAEIIRTLDDEFVGGDRVASIVARDPALTARLFGLANSAYFGLVKPATEMRDVVNRVLGVDTVRLLAFGLATNLAFPTSRCPAFDSSGFWRRSLAVATSCRGICHRITDLNAAAQSHAYVAGLCADIGLLAMVYLEPDAAQRAFVSFASNPERNLAEHVADEFGLTPLAVTADVAHHWNLPDLLVDAYRQRAQPTDEQSGLALALTAAIDAAGHNGEPATWSTGAYGRLGLSDDTLRASAISTPRRREACGALGAAF